MATFMKGVRFLSTTVTKCQRLLCTPTVLSNSPQLMSPTSVLAILQPQTTCGSALIHTSSQREHYKNTEFSDKAITKIGKVKLVAPNWHRYNDIVYPPTEPGEPERPAEVCHSRFQIKYSTKKLWYIAVMIRGMSIDEAIKQLSFHRRKGAAHVKETLEEAQEIAVRDHNVEYKSNLWIADSFVSRGIIIKGIRKHARMRYGVVNYRYTNYFVRLREGKPPKHYYPPEKTGNDLMAEYIRKQRERRIPYGM